MNKETYTKKRVELLDNMKASLDAADVTAAAATRKEVEKLDADYAAYCLELTNLNALKDVKIPKGAPVGQTAKVVDVESTQADGDAVKAKAKAAQDKLYEAAFAKFMLNQSMTSAETEIFDKINTPEAQPTAAMTAADHSVLVPTTLRAGIWEEIGKQHPILAKLARTVIHGDVDIIVETSSGDDAEWYDEATTVKDGDTAQKTITLKGCELAKAIPVSWKLKKMAINEFLAYVAKKLADKMANALAVAVVSGKGVPGTEDTFKAQPLGILTALAAETNTPQVLTYTEAEGITYKKLTAFMALVKSGYLTNAVFYATNKTIWTQLANITDTTGRPMFIPDVVNGSIGKLFGIPVVEEDAVEDGEVLLANVSDGYAMNVNEDVSMYFEDHIKARTTDYMGYALIAGTPLTNKAFALLKKAA